MFTESVPSSAKKSHELDGDLLKLYEELIPKKKSRMDEGSIWMQEREDDVEIEYYRTQEYLEYRRWQLFGWFNQYQVRKQSLIKRREELLQKLNPK